MFKISEHRKVVVVLGMHRSGTSVITRGLKALGIELGDNLLPAAEDNPRGFWEDYEIIALNERVLAAMGRTWHSLRSIDEEELSSAEIEKLKADAVQLVKEKLRSTILFGFKDPRVPRLLPFWQKVFQHLGLQDTYVIAIRNPLSVAKSLEVRNGFAPEKSHFLWIQHLLPSISQTEGKPRVVVDFDAVIVDPLEQMRRIAKTIDIKIDENVSETLIDYADDFLDLDIRHSVFGPDDIELDPGAPDFVGQAFSLVYALAQDRSDFSLDEFQARWKGIEKKVRSFGPLLHLVDQLDTSCAEAHAVAAERDAQIAGLNQALSERNGQIAELNQALSGLDGQIAELGKALSDRDEQISAFKNSWSWKVTHPVRILKKLLLR